MNDEQEPQAASVEDSVETRSQPQPEGDGGELVTLPPLSPNEKADKIIRTHVMWSMGAGLVPIPLADIAGVAAIQMDALKKLSEVYDIPYTEDSGKRFITALAGGVAARMGASMIKAIPGVGSVIGGISMAAMSGASTYAICQVSDNHFRTHGDFIGLDWNDAKAAYQKALEKGKKVVKALEQEKPVELAETESEAATNEAVKPGEDAAEKQA